MNGGEAILRSLVASGVDVCFANPGTSEMHFVAALDRVSEMRPVLTLFEGVATGAADGFARMTARPAAVLLHLGPGLGNGLANLHNARRAHTPLVVIVGDHATYHKRFDAQLESDIESAARNVSSWVRRGTRAEDAGADAADAVRAACGPPGQVATLIIPADVSWSEGGGVAPPMPASAVSGGSPETVAAIAAILRSGEPSLLLLGGSGTTQPALRAAARVRAACGASVLCETFPARLERGGGLPEYDRLAYLAEMASAQLAGVRHLVLAGAKSPVSFFAYPGRPSDLVPEGCEVSVLAPPGFDVAGPLEELAAALGAGEPPVSNSLPRREPPSGELSADTIGLAIAAHMPEGTIVCEEAATSGIYLSGPTAQSPRHDWLTLTGGAIGQGLPLAVGAAVACPDRPVLALEADGSSLYTVQALWSMAREGINVTTVIFNNRRYAILRMELARVGAAGAGDRAETMLDIGSPDIDFVALARGFGVPASRPESAEQFAVELQRAFAEPGPHLIDAVIPSLF